MNLLYPANPSHVPSDLTHASKQYKWHAWQAMVALIVFVACYVGLSSWFAWKAYKLIVLSFGGAKSGILIFGLGLCAAFLAVFMIKALFFVNRNDHTLDLEVTAKGQPALFEFLNQLAKDTGAPRPHRVFLSPRVNAAVFYDLSILNLIFPSKKNLDIGLPLVNVLTISEFKAVLAHEFGHFAQRSMAVGRWVYVAQQIARHLINKRDALDRFLAGLSHVGFGIFWVGWLLSTIVWAIRALVESVFSVVVIAQRALSREMELQADLVAVSVTGSEALMQALQRTSAADAAWDKAIAFANEEINQGFVTADLLAVQSRVIEQLRFVLDDPTYGAAAPVPDAERKTARLFKAGIAQTSKMWASHPLNHERENNAKRIFVDAKQSLDSAWLIFKQPAELRQAVSNLLIQHRDPPLPARTLEQSLAKLDESYALETYSPRYKGLYLNNALAIHWESAHAMANAKPSASNSNAAKPTLYLYPDELKAQLTQLGELYKQKQQLEALQDGKASVVGQAITHRGVPIHRKTLPNIIQSLTHDIKRLNQRLLAHDALCRSHHRALAQHYQLGWPEYWTGLIQVLHYAEHCEANLRDYVGMLNHTLTINTATGPAGKDGGQRILMMASQLHAALADIHEQHHALQLDPATAALLPAGSWEKTLGDFRLEAPRLDNLNAWIPVIDGWINQFRGALFALIKAALEQLLLTEKQLRSFDKAAPASADLVANASNIVPALPPATAPRKYPTLMPGQERKRIEKLSWWKQLQTGNGMLPTVSRFGIAGAILVAVVSVGGAAMTAKTYIYNGLEQTLQVTVDEQLITVPAHTHRSVELAGEQNHKITTRTVGGEMVETFEINFDTNLADKVYNIASAAPLIEWTANYGTEPARPDNLLGAKRWQDVGSDVVFEEPPKTVSSKSSKTRSVLAYLPANSSASHLFDLTKNKTEQAAMIQAHALWDDSKALNTMAWLYAAVGSKDYASILDRRLKRDPMDILTLRMKLDDASTEQRVTLCEGFSSLDASNSHADLKYLVARCIVDPRAKSMAFVDGYIAYPSSSWFASASAYVFAMEQRWADSSKAFERAVQLNPTFRNHLSLDAARVWRASGSPLPMNAFIKDSNPVKQQLAYDTDTVITANMASYGYVLLRQGNLKQAQAKAKTMAVAGDRLIKLIAASDGASPEMVSQALAYYAPGAKPPADFDDALWMMAALSLREGLSTPSLEPMFKQMSPSTVSVMLAYINSLAQRAPFATSESLTRGLDPALLGNAYAMGVVVWGDKAPSHWREQAKKLLFSTERPYFK